MYKLIQYKEHVVARLLNYIGMKGHFKIFSIIQTLTRTHWELDKVMFNVELVDGSCTIVSDEYLKDVLELEKETLKSVFIDSIEMTTDIQPLGCPY